MSQDLSRYLAFACRTVREAGQLTLQHFHQPLEPDIKADGSPVTVADRGAEAHIRRAIESAFPTHAILGEEFGEARSQASHRWHIDPIDGTRSFIRGVPLYAVLLGLEIDGRCEVGAAYFPALDEMVSAATGLGCRWNDRPARVSQVGELSQALITFTDARNFWKYNRQDAFIRLVQATRHSPGWTDAYGYALAATGRADAALDPITAPWDCSPFPAIFREAGGYFGDWQGRETIYGDQALGCNRALLPALLEILNP